MNSSSSSDITTGSAGAGGVISARFAKLEQAEKALTDLKSASFSGSDLGLVPHDRDAQGGAFGEPRADTPEAADAHGATVTVAAGARRADAERILRAAGGEVETASGGATSPATANVIAPSTNATDMHVPDTLIRQRQAPNEGSGRLLS